MKKLEFQMSMLKIEVIKYLMVCMCELGKRGHAFRMLDKI